MNDYETYNFSLANFDAEIKKDLIKNVNREEVRWFYGEEKELQRQRIQENRKKHIEVVTIQGDGTLEIETKNLAIPTSKRKICNFKAPNIMKLFSRTASTSVWMFECETEGKTTVKIYLDERKLGDSKYLLEKFAAKGIEIYGTSRRVREDYISKIWTATLNRQQGECLIPDEFGWWRNAAGKLEFVDKDRVIWQEVKTWI